jgi:CubicO group peptidase (beta-lactamase class C family)
LEWQVPNTPTISSAILLLEETGKLKVEDPVKKYMPDAPAAWDKITIFNLLTHTSGIPNFTDFPDYRDRQARTGKRIEVYPTHRRALKTALAAPPAF